MIIDMFVYYMSMYWTYVPLIIYERLFSNSHNIFFCGFKLKPQDVTLIFYIILFTLFWSKFNTSLSLIKLIEKVLYPILFTLVPQW